MKSIGPRPGVAERKSKYGSAKMAIIELRVIHATRTTASIQNHGWLVERHAHGELTRAASILFRTEAEALKEARRLAYHEGGALVTSTT